jgi:hypothetical protein
MAQTRFANLAAFLKPSCLLVPILFAPPWHKAFVPKSPNSLALAESLFAISMVGVASPSIRASAIRQHGAALYERES